MKKVILFLFFIAGISLAMNAQTTQSEKKNPATIGVRFFEGTWNEALKKSISEKKPIFLDISAPWCGYCKKLRINTFTDNDAGKFFNANFINVELNGEEGDGARLAKLYNVTGYPSLFIIDNNGKIVAYTAGYYEPSEFIQFGKTALNKSN